ncbi:MAG: AAA family ATPase, partial [Burkholderiales bacterium]|nr:AAA family ATPase [Burkholderiales bacterium]
MITELRLKNFKCFETLKLGMRPLTLLAGLNGMGKSSVIQSFLLLRQSWVNSELSSGRLTLNGELTSLGSGLDILYEDAQEELIEIGLSLRFKNRSEKNIDFPFRYDRQADNLQAIPPPLTDAAKRDEILRSAENANMAPFGKQFHYIFAERFGPRKMFPMSETHIRVNNL